MLNRTKAVCQANAEHKRFSATAHVTQDWIMDEYGNYVECIDTCIDVTHEPNEEDIWTCAECGADIKFVRV